MIGKTFALGSLAGGARMAGAAALALAIVSGGALAQQKAAEPAKGAAAAPAAAPAGDQSAWVKLCEKAPIIAKDKDGKDVKEEKSICLTHHERLDGNTGMVLVSAAVRQVEGGDKQHMMVMVPLGMALAPGLRATIYNKEQWDKAQKNEKVDDVKSAPLKLQFSLCHPAGCTAELELTPELTTQLKGGAGFLVYAINAGGQVIAFPVPLTGFKTAVEGPPVDNQVYSEARKQLMQQISARQQQMYEQYKKEQEKGGQPAAGAAPAAPAATAPAAPAKKK